jgi:hypothetical protein
MQTVGVDGGAPVAAEWICMRALLPGLVHYAATIRGEANATGRLRGCGGCQCDGRANEGRYVQENKAATKMVRVKVCGEARGGLRGRFPCSQQWLGNGPEQASSPSTIACEDVRSTQTASANLPTAVKALLVARRAAPAKCTHAPRETELPFEPSLPFVESHRLLVRLPLVRGFRVRRSCQYALPCPAYAGCRQKEMQCAVHSKLGCPALHVS